MIIEGFARRFLRLKGGKQAIDLRLTHQESLATALVEPPGFEMTRAGLRFALGYTAAPTGIAPVQALATTAAQWALTNLDAYKTYWFTTVGVMLTSGTPAAGGQVFAAVFNTPAQTGVVAGAAMVNLSNSAIGSKAALKTGVTITGPAAPAWVPLAEGLSANVPAFPGGGLIVNREVQGRVALPPGQSLGLYVLAGAGTSPLYYPVLEWVEIESDLE